MQPQMSEIVRKYLAGQGSKRPLSYRKAAGAISEQLAPFGSVSYGEVFNWAAGKCAPSPFLILYLSEQSGWPAEMAGEIAKLLEEGQPS